MDRKECFLLNNFETQSKSLGNANKTTFTFVPIYEMPNIFINISGLVYVCGPLVMIFKEMAIKQNIL